MGGRSTPPRSCHPSNGVFFERDRIAAALGEQADQTADDYEGEERQDGERDGQAGDGDGGQRPGAQGKGLGHAGQHRHALDHRKAGTGADAFARGKGDKGVAGAAARFRTGPAARIKGIGVVPQALMAV